MKTISEINLKNPTEEDIEAINYYLTLPDYLEIELQSYIDEETLKYLIKEAEEELQ